MNHICSETGIPRKPNFQTGSKGKKSKYFYQSEETYNIQRSKDTGYLLLDQQLIAIPDQPGRGIEACDLLDVVGRRFIHIKKSSRQSSVLSHFFKQGSNSAQMFRKYPPFCVGLVERVRELYGERQASALEEVLDQKWTVEFHIADSPRPSGDFNIPFFSKLTLREEVRSMEAMQFGVEVKFIRLSALRKA